MNRKNFIKKTLLGAAGVATGASALANNSVKQKKSTYDKLMEQVGFNHLPNKEVKTMKTVLHKANRPCQSWMVRFSSYLFFCQLL